MLLFQQQFDSNPYLHRVVFNDRLLEEAATNSTGGISDADALCVSMFVLAGLGIIGFAAPACCNCREWYCGWIQETATLKRADSMVHIDRDGHAIEKRDSDMVWG